MHFWSTWAEAHARRWPTPKVFEGRRCHQNPFGANLVLKNNQLAGKNVAPFKSSCARLNHLMEKFKKTPHPPDVLTGSNRAELWAGRSG